MNKETLQAISNTAHSINVANGFNEAESYKRSVALIVSEMAEMLEADRKDKCSREIIEGLTQRDANMISGMTIKQAHQFIITTDDFIAWFKECVKDTIEDELADVVIRITSFLAASGHKIECDNAFDALESFTVNDLIHDLPLCEIIYNLMQATLNAEDKLEPFLELEGIAYTCFELAEIYDFDLEWHIDAKLTYNKTRSHLHGKAY